MLNPKVGDLVQVLQIGGIASISDARFLREPQIVEEVREVPTDEGGIAEVRLKDCPYLVLASDVAEWPVQSFEHVIAMIERLPLTWKPAVLTRLVETCGDAIVCPVAFVEQVVSAKGKTDDG